MELSHRGVTRDQQSPPNQRRNVVPRYFQVVDLVGALQFAPDGQTVVSVGGDKMIKLWNVEDRTLRQTIGTHALAVAAIAFSPDGRVSKTELFAFTRAIGRYGARTIPGSTTDGLPAEPNVIRDECGAQLFWRVKMNHVEAQLLRGFDIRA